MCKRICKLILFAHVFSLQIGWTQSDSTAVDSTNFKIEQLEQSLQELQQILNEQQQEDELQRLMEEAQALKSVDKKEEMGVGKKFHTGVRQQAGLNPNLSVSGDFFAGINSSDDDYIRQPSDHSYGTNTFDLRELELSLVAPLDPFTRGKSFLSVTEEAISIEEAYLEWLNLPLNMNLKVGLFNAEFGILNRYHDHALPQFDRPRVLVHYFSLAYLGGFGVAGNFLLPPLFGADASMLDLTLCRGGNGVSFTNEGKRQLLAAANYTNYYDITRNTFFEWRWGVVGGYNDEEEENSSLVANLALNVKWIPADRAKYRTIDWKTEFMYGLYEQPTGTVYSKGVYSSLQNKLNARWWVSARVDYAELPYDNQQHEQGISLAADYWQSEFVYIRFQYQYMQRNLNDIRDYWGPFPDSHGFIVQVNWAMGPHKHEAY